MDTKGVRHTGFASGVPRLKTADKERTQVPHDDGPQVRAGASLSFKGIAQAALWGMALFAHRGAGASQVSFPQMIGVAFDAGISKAVVILDPTGNGLSNECNLTASTVKGAGTKDGQPGNRSVTMFPWAPNGEEHDAEPGPDYQQRMNRTIPLEKICGGPQNARALIDVLTGQPGVRVTSINYLDKTCPAVQSLLNTPGGASVAPVSVLLALGANNDPASGSSIQFPWITRPLGSPDKNWPKDPNPSYETFLHMQKAAPTMFVIGGQFWANFSRTTIFKRDEVLAHYQGQGYLLGELQPGDGGPQDWNVSMILPPLSGVLAKFNEYANASGQKLTLTHPSQDAIKAYQKRYPKQFPELQPSWESNIAGGIGGLALSAAMVYVLYRLCGGKSARPRGAQAPLMRPQQPARGEDVEGTRDPVRKRKVKPMAPDSQDKRPTAPPGDTQRPPPIVKIPKAPPGPAGLYRDTRDELASLKHDGRRGLVKQWRSEVGHALHSGNPALASAFMRALIDNDPHAGRLGQLLTLLGLDFDEVIQKLQAQANDPGNADAGKELNLLMPHRRLVELALPREASYNGDEKGRLGPRNRPPLVPGSGVSSSSGLPQDGKAPPTDYCTMDEVHRLARERLRNGHAVESGGGIYLGGRPETMPHLHVDDFLSLKKHDGNHIRIFVNGGKFREDSFLKAVEYAQSPEGRMNPEIGKVLDFIRGRGPYATPKSA